MIDLPVQNGTLSVLVLLTFASVLNLPFPVQARTAPTANSTPNLIDPSSERSLSDRLKSSIAQRSEFTPLNVKLPTDGGKPTRRRSTGRRGLCSKLEKPLIALVPPAQDILNESTEPDLIDALGRTTQSSPVSWFYVPQLPAGLRQAEFRLLNDNGDDILTKRVLIDLPETPGIFGLSLPPTREPLQLNQTYQWSVSIQCDPDKPSTNPTVVAWIERVDPGTALSERLAQATDTERLRLYAENGLWHETLTLLAQLRRNKLEDRALAEVWTQLLNDVGLDDIATDLNVPYYFVPQE